MNIAEIKVLINKYINKPFVEFEINKSIFDDKNGNKNFNKIIRDKVIYNKYGIYVWENAGNKEIIYIGMAGKIKTNGEFVNHSVQKRLQASRIKDENNKYIQTNVLVRNLMNKHNIEILNFYVFYTKDRIPPAYLEAILLYNFYKIKFRLPDYNNTF